MELTEREITILGCIVERYIGSGAPVASRQIAGCSGLALSSASVRNVMAGLEKKGLVSRPHTSAGSIPTDQGFRIYVDALRPRHLPNTTRRQLEHRMESMRRELVEDLEWVARVAAEATSEAGLAMRPMGEEPVIEAVSLVPLGDRQVLGVVVTSDGVIEKRLLVRDDRPTPEALLEESNLLTRKFRGHSIRSARRAQDRAGSPHETAGPLEGRAAASAQRLFAEESDDVELRLAGTDNLLNSEDFVEAERVRSLFSTLQDRKRLADECRKAFDRGPTQVIIGNESEVTASGNLGMVVTLFFKAGHRAGALGVVGPRRMDYGRIVPVVEFIGDTLTRMFEEPGATHA